MPKGLTQEQPDACEGDGFCSPVDAGDDLAERGNILYHNALQKRAL